MSKGMAAAAEFEKEKTLLKENGLKTSSLRIEYEKKVRELQEEKERLLAEGCPVEKAARRLHSMRRELGRTYKDAAPPLFREYILYATEKKYGDPLGPDYETLRKTKTAEQIMESSARPIRDLDNRLSIDGFDQWFHTVYQK